MFFSNYTDNRNTLYDYETDVIIFFWPFTTPINPVKYAENSQFKLNIKYASQKIIKSFMLVLALLFFF